MKDKRSFFEKLTGAVKMEDTDTEYYEDKLPHPHGRKATSSMPKEVEEDEMTPDWMEEEAEEGQLTVDVYQTSNDVVIKCMVAGVRPEDLEINITRDTITIRGKRETEKLIREEDYFHKELYWGSFSRTIMLPTEVDVEEADAVEKHGLLIIKLPKIDKHRQARLKVKGN